MKGVILAGGLGTRLYPITRVVNKHVLPVGDKPVIYYPIQTLLDSGVTDLGIVVGPPHGDQVKEIVKHYPLRDKLAVTYIRQPSPQGMAEAIGRCEEFAGSDPVIVITGDNIFGGNFREEVRDFSGGAVAFLREVDDPQRYGVPVFNENGALKEIVEKPSRPASNWIVACPYLFDNRLFKFIDELEPSERGELEVTDLLSRYVADGQLRLVKRRDLWLDIGTFSSLSKANRLEELSPE